MQIRELEERTGLERATIRFYEREGFLKPTRQENGYRSYSQEDCETLLKIKFLRQLGISLERVRGLQQGTLHFSDALAEQIHILSGQIQSSTWAQEVCQEMQSAGVQYETLDVHYYASRLSRPLSTGPAWEPKPVPEFWARRNRPKYPWRRFFARFLDAAWILQILNLLVFLVLRIRPGTNGSEWFLETFLKYASYFLMIPICTVLVHIWGTTPGKWALGIRLESAEGGRLTLHQAWNREVAVLRDGMGWGILFWELLRLYNSKREYQEAGECSWDEDVEIHVLDPVEHKKTAMAAAFVLLIALTSALVAGDMMLPKYRENVTVSQYAENYNYLRAQLTQSDGEYIPMNPDGSFTYENYISVNGTLDSGEDACVFITDQQGRIQKILYDQTWRDIFYLNCQAGRSVYYAYTALASQPGVTFWDMIRYAQLLDEASWEESGRISYRNLDLTWSVSGEGYHMQNGYCIAVDQETPTWVRVRFEITILDP